PQPVLKDFHNIECRDAVLAYDRVEFVTDERGVPVTRWDGKTLKKHPVTGEDVPDDKAQIPLERYVNPRKAVWPEADFVVGNPPFIGAGPMRAALGDGYVEALRGAWTEVPDSADFVMYWWDHAAELTRAGQLRQFGLITTNSLRQTFNRRVVERHLSDKRPLSLVFAIPDHPWVDSADGAAVRIAMTVGASEAGNGRLMTTQSEEPADDGELQVSFARREGLIHADLRIGANVTAAVPLVANGGISSAGVKLHGAGFIVTEQEAVSLGLGQAPELDEHIPLYRNGKDLTARPRNVRVIDLYGLRQEDVRKKFPAVYQWIFERVKPERDAKADTKDGAGYAKYWWLHGKPRSELRPALKDLQRYVATVETTKHRAFQFLDAAILPDNMLTAIASDDAHLLGVLSSNVHVTWALAAGGRLGVGNDPRYNKSRCFEPFPFPAANPDQQSPIRDLAEQLDAHRKKQQAQHAELTLTGMYNVLEKLKSGAALTAKEKVIHEQGLVAVLKTLHDELDRAVLDAYGWNDLAPLQDVVNGNAAPASVGMATREDAHRALTDTLLERLVALNAERAAEEAKGTIRWLRPEFQAKGAVPEKKPQQTTLVGVEDEATETAVVAVPAARVAWPKELPEQVRLVAQALADARAPLTEDAIAARFQGRGPWKKRLPQIIDTLIAVGRVRPVDGGKAYVIQ
ncbi:MAG: class I SAM-dependent DNA methyltransferase, partial [Burkholderiales bacterium]|nr:class I SAM-dependent DNA methyltransferase [Burkholderiales bacterium]